MKWNNSNSSGARYDHFIAIVTQVVDLIRSGRGPEARETQLPQANPLADRLERLTNQFVNRAEADMVVGIETSARAYAASQSAILRSRWVASLSSRARYAIA
jgi:hypothetical protein